MAFSPPDDLLALGDRLGEIRFTPRTSLGPQILAATRRTAPTGGPSTRSVGWMRSLLGSVLIVSWLVYLLWHALLTSIR